MTIFLNKIKKNIILIILLVIFILIICKSPLVVSSVINASKIYFNNVFPCMFIFYTLGDLLINYNFYKVFNTRIGILISRLFNLNQNSLIILFFSMLLGFPSGSKYICSFLDKEYISYETGKHLLYITHFSNPIFILGSISIITNFKLSILILISHYLSNFILLFSIRNKFIKENIKYVAYNSSFIDCLNESFKNTLNIIVVVYFNTIIFITLGSLINSIYINKTFHLIINIIFDITNGIISINSANYSFFIKGLLITFLLSFGGINIHFQVKSLLENKKLPYSFFLKGRIYATLLSLLIYIILFIMV